VEDIDNLETNVDTKMLMDKAQSFFKRNGLLLNWKEFEKLDFTQQINTLAMIAPITNEEKQKLLESVSLENKIKSLESIISFYLFDSNSNSNTIQ
jgi:Lon protease-like protein